MGKGTGKNEVCQKMRRYNYDHQGRGETDAGALATENGVLLTQ